MKEAERRQTQVRLSAPAGAGAPRRVPACADPPLRARSPVGVPLRLLLEMSEHLRPASGQASWDAVERVIGTREPVFPKDHGHAKPPANSLDGRYPPLPVPVQ
jgi:hypothetical protein